MHSVKNEPVLSDVISFHQKRHGVSTDPLQRLSSTIVDKTVPQAKVDINPEDNWQVVFEEIPNEIYVPCLVDLSEKVTLISVRLANTKICSVFPNIDQASKQFESLRKPLTTRSVKFQTVIDRYNRVIQHDCAHEYGADFQLTLSDKFVLFNDFKSYYENVQKAFPSIWQNTETSVPEEDISVVQGGILELGHIPCPYISRGSAMLLPSKIVRIATKGLDPSNDSLILESVPFLNGWPASPREIAFLTLLCSSNNIPLMFGRDTRLLPLSQVSCLFNDKMVIGNSIGNGRSFKKPAKPQAIQVSRSNGTGSAAVSQNSQNGSITSTVTGTTPQLVNVTTTIPSTIHYTPDQNSDSRQFILQNIPGLRWIATRPMQVLNIQQNRSEATTDSSTTAGGEKRRRLEVENVSNARNPQSVGCS